MSNVHASPAEPPSLNNDASNKEVLRSAFVPTPLKKPSAPRSHTPSASASAQSGIKKYTGTHATSTPPSPPPPPPVDECQPDALQKNPTQVARAFQSEGVLPNGFPEPRDVTTDVQGGKIQVRGQNRFSHVDQIATDPPLYLDTSPLPPGDLLRALVPVPQILLSGDGMPYPGFLRSLSVADMPGFDWMKLIGTTSLIILPSFARF